MGKAWLVASGKGGVGKSTVVSALAQALARQGMRTCVVDGDIGLRDQDALLGLENRIVYDLVDVSNKECRLTQALISPLEQPNLSLLPASQFARAKELDPKAFRRIIAELKKQFDHVIIDGPAGIERGLRGILTAEYDETLIVCTPDDVCIRNAERAVFTMESKKLPRPAVIVNRLVPDLIEAGEMYAAQVVAQTLDLPLMGEIPEDQTVYRALITHVPLMDTDCEAQRALARIAQRMKGENAPLPDYGRQKRAWYHKLFRRRIKEVKRIDR
ncbi:MAG: septum site-determining protein MinD [Clostridia bacterium]|nr:septum site-determining protein MinD [Clostridia bacterium]